MRVRIVALFVAVVAVLMTASQFATFESHSVSVRALLVSGETEYVTAPNGGPVPNVFVSPSSQTTTAATVSVISVSAVVPVSVTVA